MQVDVCPVAAVALVNGKDERGGGECSPFHADQLQVAAKVPGVQPRYRQSVSKASHWGLKIALVEIRIEAWCLVDGSVHVGPDERDGRAWDAAALVRDLNGDVLLALGDDDLCDREVLLILAMALDDGTQRVLQCLEEHMRKMARDVHEADVVVADELDLGGIEQAVVVFADKAGVLDGLLGELADIGLGADDADVVGIGA